MRESINECMRPVKILPRVVNIKFRYEIHQLHLKVPEMLISLWPPVG